MNLLLDTHTFIWFSEADSNLSNKVKSLIEDYNNKCFLSFASIWEMAIKVSLDKLKIRISFDTLKKEIINQNIEILQLSFDHMIVLSKLPFHHRDPFDRLIIAQSIVENYPIITRDNTFDDYNIRRIW